MICGTAALFVVSVGQLGSVVMNRSNWRSSSDKEWVLMRVSLTAILMKKAKRKVPLPIGRMALLAYTVQALRQECCEAADALVNQRHLDEAELEECARLDDALAAAHRILKTAVARVTMARLQRRSNIQ